MHNTKSSSSSNSNSSSSNSNSNSTTGNVTFKDRAYYVGEEPEDEYDDEYRETHHTDAPQRVELWDPPDPYQKNHKNKNKHKKAGTSYKIKSKASSNPNLVEQRAPSSSSLKPSSFKSKNKKKCRSSISFCFDKEEDNDGDFDHDYYNNRDNLRNKLNGNGNGNDDNASQSGSVRFGLFEHRGSITQDILGGSKVVDMWKQQQRKSMMKKQQSMANLEVEIEIFESKRSSASGEGVAYYPADCYSFLACYHPFKNPGFFAFGFAVFMFQMLFLSFMILSKTLPLLSSNGEVDNPSEGPIAAFIPSNVSVLVRLTQITAVLSYCVFADSSLKDVVTAVEMFPRFDRARNNDQLGLVVLSCTLRFIQGLLAIVGTLLMVITSSDVVEIILNFTAISFISDLDEAAFELAKWGKYGPLLEAEAKSIEKRPIPYYLYRKDNHVRFRYTVIPIAVLLMAVMAGIVYGQRADHLWVTQTLRIQLQDSTGLQSYSGCYKMDQKLQHHNRKNYNGYDANPDSGIIGFCNKRRHWILFKNETSDEKLNTDPCKVQREEELAHSAKTDKFDISSAFDEMWYSASGTPLDLYFFDATGDGVGLNENCGSFLNNGKCDDLFNTIDYQYDGGDCCASTCVQANCGVNSITSAFGVKGAGGDGFPKCNDPELVPITIKLETISSSRDEAFLNVTDIQLDEYFREKGIDFWTEQPVTPFFIVDCNDVNVLSTYVNDTMLGNTETLLVEDGASCRISVSNTTNFFEKWDNDPIWWVRYTVYHGNGTQYPIITGDSYVEESTEFQRVTSCYFDKLGGSLDLSTAYDATKASTKALRWMINDESGHSSCSNDFLIERYALAEVNYAAPIQPENETESVSALWISIQQQCRWENIACDVGSVETMAVRSKVLTGGTIPSSVGLLTGLRRMDYDSNGLVSTIPSEIGRLTNLKGLDIDNNELTGTIPTELGQLINMVELDLDKNKLTGTIPTEFGNMKNAREFDLIYNQLSGAIPSEIGKLTILNTLSVVGNELTGMIPTEIGKMSNLIGVELAHNAISGTIPSQIENTKETAKVLWLSNNIMFGTIPTQIGRLTKLEKLELDENSFSGSIPSEVGLMTSLYLMNLRGNNFSGMIPSEIGLLTNLKEIRLDRNNFMGTIPREILFLERLRILTSDDGLSGVIPDKIKTLNPCAQCGGSEYDLKDYKGQYFENADYGIRGLSCEELLESKNDPDKFLSANACKFLTYNCISCGSGSLRDTITL